MTHRPLAVVGLVWALGGCSLDYGQDKTTPADQVPLMVFDGLKQTAVKDGRTLYTFEASHAEVFQARKQMLLKDLEFQEYDAEGQVASHGTADAATVDTNSNDASVSGRLQARSRDQGVTLEVQGGDGGALAWKNDDRILSTGAGARVVLDKDDGSRVDAKSLTLDLSANRLDLEDGVQGTWTPEEKNDDAKTPAPAAGPPPRPSP